MYLLITVSVMANIKLWNFSSSYSNLLPKTIEHMPLATALLIRPLIHTWLPRSFATTLTKRLASFTIVDSIDVLPNPKPLNKLNVNTLCSFHGCAAASPVPKNIYLIYWVSGCFLAPGYQFVLAMSWWEQNTFWWDSDVLFVLDQHIYLDYQYIM